jgi:predicted enzyme related to lactoylglutathione lyase
MPIIQVHTPGTPCWADLMTPNPGIAREFYGEVFDWTFEVGGPTTGGYTMCRLEHRTVAGLGQLPPNSRFPTAWQVYFATNDVESTAARAIAAGGQMMMAPTRILELGSLAVVSDCTGATVGLWQAQDHIGAEIMGEPNSLTWCEVNTRDRARAETFYAEVFHLVPRQLGAMEYSTLHCTTPIDSPALCGVLQMTTAWGEMASHWTVYFAVVNLKATTERIVANGGRLCYPAFDTPRGRLAIVEDPMGATFTIIEPRVA